LTTTQSAYMSRPSPSLRLRLVLTLSVAIAALPAHARTWTDTQNRTIDADYVSATAAEVTVRRSDGITFTLPLARLSSADQTFVTEQLAAEQAAPAPDFEQFNAFFGLPLLADGSLWDDAPA